MNEYVLSFLISFLSYHIFSYWLLVPSRSQANEHSYVLDLAIFLLPLFMDLFLVFTLSLFSTLVDYGTFLELFIC